MKAATCDPMHCHLYWRQEIFDIMLHALTTKVVPKIAMSPLYFWRKASFRTQNFIHYETCSFIQFTCWNSLEHQGTNSWLTPHYYFYWRGRVPCNDTQSYDHLTFIFLLHVKKLKHKFGAMSFTSLVKSGILKFLQPQVNFNSLYICITKTYEK